MSQFANTMPEARFRSTKKRQPTRPAQSLASIVLVDPARHLHLVAAEAAPAPAKAKAKKAEPKHSVFSIASWWPIAVGLFLTGFAPEWHAMAMQAGVWAMRLAFPLSLIAAHREIGLSGVLDPQTALYAQLPLDGILTMLTLQRKNSLQSAIVQLILLHATCAFVLWLVTFASN